MAGWAPETIAYASCWMNYPTRDDAYARAKVLIADLGWHVEAVLEDHALTGSSYSPDDEGLRYYEQALLDDEVIVFYVAQTPEN